MDDYYVYAYLRESDNTPYYIGKGRGKRAFTNQNHSVSLPKDRSKIHLYQTGLSENDAFLLEKEYIKLFGRKDNNTGILLNRTEGGEGVSGVPKPWRSKANKINPPRKGTKTSKKARENMSIAAKNNPRKYWLGKNRDEETKNKISETKKGTVQTEEHKMKNSNKIKELWKDPVWRDKMLTARKKKKDL